MCVCVHPSKRGRKRVGCVEGGSSVSTKTMSCHVYIEGKRESMKGREEKLPPPVCFGGDDIQRQACVEVDREKKREG